MKMAGSSQNGYETLWEEEKLLVTSNFFFSVFSKDLYCKQVKTRACLGKGLKIVIKRENADNQHFHLFPLCFLPFQEQF